jgi:murein DD-endopeptidase MepM/ murein hydrolase activator NlpD
VKLAVCLALFTLAALLKFAYPQVLETVGNKINETMNYKAALTALGEGISGEKKFTTALGEAFTYAFTGGGALADENTAQHDSGADNTDASAADTSSAADVADEAAAAAVFAENDENAEDASTRPGVEDASANSLPNAVVSAFLDSQEEFSDYAIPAGATYEMPSILFDFANPVAGVVSSSFGYRHAPGDGTVKFHFGTDIAARAGTEIKAFADGKVISVGDSASLGKYVVVSHNGIETQYGHCSAVYVSTAQAVTKGQKLAAVGKTGNATDNCLHFELKVNGINVNPQYYIDWS